ncbi:MAG TPA: hypothetical protein VN663_14440 [Ramlibacter sp.]|jgi:hypothetical protein|nr:hypothetical protein [Ramlibacter sp.]
MHNLINFKSVTMSFANAGLAAGTTSTYSTTASTNAAIRGKWATVLTAQTNTASPTTDVNTGLAFRSLAPNKATVLVWGVNAAGAIQLVQGTITDTLPGVTTTVGAFNVLPQFPVIPDDFVAIGYTLIRTAPSAATWTPGTSAWAASGVTSLFVNVSTLPDRPQSS